MTSLSSLAASIKRLEGKLPTKAVEMTPEEWAQIQQVFSTTALCSVCRPRVDQALVDCERIKPTSRARRWYPGTRGDTLFKALEPCTWCRVTVAAALMDKEPDHSGEHCEGVLQYG